MRAEFVIEGMLPGTNDYQRANRASPYAGGRLKKRETDRVAWSAKAGHMPRFDKPVRIDCEWIEPHDRRDPDNITGGRKFIHDGLVKAGVIEDDDQRHVRGMGDSFSVDRVHPRVVVTVSDGE